VPTYEALAVLLIPLGVLMIIETRSRLEALLALASVGAMLALLFLFAGAPDLALIQLFLVTLSSVLLLLLFPLFPTRYNLGMPRAQRLGDTLLAIGVGVLMGVTTFVVALRDPVTAISATYLAQSVPQGQGANVVTVILTDFRSFDTLGLIVVLLIALLSIYGLLRLRRSQIPGTGMQAGE
jgi:multisubunit Na+/H+ antiporter MnhB subunit